MPIIKSAIKKLRQDKKREKQNNLLRDSLKATIRAAKKSNSGKTISLAIATVDKAEKKNIIHKNKAARIKSALSKIAKPVKSKSLNKPLPKKSGAKKAKSSKAKTVKKTSAKKT